MLKKLHIILLCALMVLALLPTYAFAAGDVASGTYHGVPWRITATYELVIGQKGTTSTFEAGGFRQYGLYPWEGYRASIKSVRFEGKVVGTGLMNGMFSNCTAMTKANLTGFETSQVTGMNRLFAGCGNLQSLTFGSGFRTGAVNDLAFLFSGCSKLRTLDVSGFDTGSAETMACMFEKCSSLTSLNLLSFNTAKAENLSGMFSGCSSLKSLNLKSFNTSNALYMGEMFYQCSSLTKLDLSMFNTSKVFGMDRICGECTNLKSLNVSSFDTSMVNSSSFALTHSDKLQEIALGPKTAARALFLYAAPDPGAWKRTRLLNGTAASGPTIDNLYHYDKNYPGWYTAVKEEATAQPPASPVRLAGADRYATSREIATAFKKELGVSKLNAVCVADGQNFPDALAGAYFASQKKAPILVVHQAAPTGDKSMATINYIKANLPKGKTVYILGGPGSVPEIVETTLKKAGYKVQRLWGANRYGSNLSILKAANVKAGTDFIVCTGAQFADALSASATGKPVLLVAGNKLTADQKAYLKTIHAKSFTIVGTTKDVAASIEAELKTYAPTTRLAGTTIYDRSIQIAKKFFPGTQVHINLADGRNFPDALCGGPLAAKLGGPLLLTDGSSAVNQKIRTYTKAAKTGKATIFGGPASVSDATANYILGIK